MLSAVKQQDSIQVINICRVQMIPHLNWWRSRHQLSSRLPQFSNITHLSWQVLYAASLPVTALYADSSCSGCRAVDVPPWLLPAASRTSSADQGRKPLLLLLLLVRPPLLASGGAYGGKMAGKTAAAPIKSAGGCPGQASRKPAPVPPCCQCSCCWSPCCCCRC